MILIEIILAIAFFFFLSQAICETIWGICLILFGFACHILALILFGIAKAIRIYERLEATASGKRIPSSCIKASTAYRRAIFAAFSPKPSRIEIRAARVTLMFIWLTVVAGILAGTTFVLQSTGLIEQFAKFVH